MNPLFSWIESHGGLVGLGVALAKLGLIAFSVLSLAVAVERFLALRRIRHTERAHYATVRDFMTLGGTFEGGHGPCQAIARAGVENPRRAREAMEREASAQIAALSFNLPILASAASTAPYIGLFGTVLGILAAFRQIAQSGQTGAAVVAGGISEALTVTALGLGVAIPAVIAYNFFVGRVNALAMEIEAHAEELASLLELHLAEEKTAPKKPATVPVQPNASAKSRLLERLNAAENAAEQADAPTDGTTEVKADAPTS